jgi:hypothetical protein
MGSWGTGLYANDIASDMRDDFQTVRRAPWDGDGLRAWASDDYPMIDDPADDDHTDALLVLADLFWTHGIEHPATLGGARRIIDDGSDLARKRELGMTERDLARRARLLTTLASKWAAPNPRPRDRHILTSAEPFLFEEGGVLAYPTSKGVPRNPYVSPAHEADHERRFGWRHDGWGAAIVIARRRQHDVFAWYAMALLAASAPARPSLAEIARMSILHTEVWVETDEGAVPSTTRQIHPITMSRSHRDRLRVEIVGRLALRTDLVESEVMPPLLRRHWDESLANAALVGRRSLPVDDPIARYLA